MVELAIVLQRCTRRYEEIWEGVRKDHVALTSLKRVPSLTPRAEVPTSPPTPNPSASEPLEDVYKHGAMPKGTVLDLTAFESMQVTISHTPVTGKVYLHIQAQSITMRCLSGTSSQGHLKPSPKIEEL